MNLQIIHKDKNTWLKKEVVQDIYNCVYVGEFSLKHPDGGWSTNPVSVFYQETPIIEGYDNYFGLFYDLLLNAPKITSAAAVRGCVYTGIVSEDGGLCTYTGHHHDCQYLPDGSYIDGGLDYIRIGSRSDGKLPRTIKLKIQKDKLVVHEEEACS